MKIPVVIAYDEKEAKKILAENGFEATSIYYDNYKTKIYTKTNIYRVIRQIYSNGIVKLLLVPQHELELKGGGENGS